MIKVTETTTLQELVDMAKESLNDVYAGETFIVKELFRGFEWNRIPKGLRTKLGSMFLLYAQGEAIDQLEVMGKTPQNQQIYKKK